MLRQIGLVPGRLVVGERIIAIVYHCLLVPFLVSWMVGYIGGVMIIVIVVSRALYL